MKKSLNLNWDFIPSFIETYLSDFPINHEKIDVPHTINKLPLNYFDESVFFKKTTYRKTFKYNENNKRVFLCFDGFMVEADIYLNGTNLGHHISCYKKVRIEISDYIKEDNELLVILDSSENKNIPPFGYAIDYLTFGGIYRDVYLEIEEQTYIEDIRVSGDHEGNLSILTTIDNKEKVNTKVKYELYFENRLIIQFDTPVIKINGIKPWDINEPNLYILKAILITDKYETYKEIRFGFRTIYFDRSGFYLNNKKIQLLGLNRHQSYPYIGYAASKSLQEEDALILKNKIGINVVRTSHYPQSKYFLDKCDEIGLLVINEIPGWQHIGESKEWRDNYYDFVKSMVIEQYNHPSLIMHGVRIDESQDDHELYIKGNEIAHSLDKTRPTIGVRNFKNSELLEDIYGYNDFICDSLDIGLISPKKVKHKRKPYLVTEYLGHLEPTKSSDNSKQREYHALRHFKVIDDNFKHYKNSLGAIGWCAFDYYTHKDFGSGDHICHHGVYDMFRNPKPAFSAYSSQQDNFNVLEFVSSLIAGDKPEANIGKFYVATNADYLDLYRNGAFVKRFYPDRKTFKYLPHPPIVIDDYVGEAFKDDRFTKSDQKKMGKILGYVSCYGFNHLKLKHYLSLGRLMMKYKLKYADLVDLWNKEVATWGGMAKYFTFKAYKNDKLVNEKTIGPSLKFDLNVETSSTHLIHKDSYDMASIHISYVDDTNNVCVYASRVVEIKCEGALELVSPNLIPLVGGVSTIYVKTTRGGEGRVTIKVDDIIKEVCFIIEGDNNKPKVTPKLKHRYGSDYQNMSKSTSTYKGNICDNHIDGA